MSAVPPPSDTLAEMLVLSSGLLRPHETVDACADLMSADDFFKDQHRWVWRALLALTSGPDAVDLVAVRAWLQQEKRLDQVGGSTYLSKLQDELPSIGRVERSARTIHELAVVRKLIRAADLIGAEGRDPENWRNVPNFIERAESQILDAGQLRAARVTASSMWELMAEATEDLDRSQEGKEVLPGTPTGLPSLDRLTGGLAPGDFWIVAGRPGMGKTALALFIALAVSAHVPVVFFSLEMSRLQLRQRALASRSNIGVGRLRSRNLDGREWDKITDKIDELSKLKLVVDEVESLTPATLRSKVRRHQAHFDEPIGLVVTDYLQLMGADPSPDRRRTRNEELEEISRAHKLLARQFNCTVLAAAQLKRADPSKKDKRPQLDELRGSGALEQDADNVVFIHRDDGYRRNQDEHDGVCELLLPKGRACGTGECEVAYHAFCTQFVDNNTQPDLFEEAPFG